MQEWISHRTLPDAAVFQAVLLTVQVTLYFGCEIFQKNFHNVLRRADEKIPFFPPSVFIYILWFPLIAAFPLGLFLWNQTLYLRYIAAILFDIVISIAVYLIYPTTFERPVPPDTLSGRVMKIVYTGSYRGVNCMPSLHCSQCFLIIAFACMCAEMPLWAMLTSVLLSLGIVASTVLTKQHALIDMLTALPAAAISFLCGMLLCGIL